MKRTQLFILTGLLILLSMIGCTNQDAAQLGAMIGRTLGKPVGTVATAIDETVQTSGDIVRENPRYQNPPPRTKPTQPTAPAADGNYYYRTEVLVKTRGPAQIESMELREVEDVSEFWK